MDFLLSVLSIGMLCYIYGCFKLKVDYMKCFVYGMATFFCEYVLIAGILFCFDGFFITRTLKIQMILNLALLGFAIWKGTFSVEPFQFKKYRLFLIVWLLLIPIKFSGNGYFGMGQDQGVYQVKALFLMNDKTEKQLYYNEIDKLETAAEKRLFEKDVFRNGGYDIYETEKWFNSEEKRINVTSGYFHGVQTFPALLAWTGRIFGVENMMLCQLFFLFLFLAFVSFVCDEITDREWVKFSALITIGFSPILLWVAKSALTEMFLALLFVMFFYFLKRGEGRHIWLSLLPVVTYSFFHVTIYTMMPMFVCIFLFYYLKTGRRNYLYVGMANVAGFLLGFFTMLRGNPSYTTSNYFNGLSFLSFLNAGNLPFFLVLVCAIAILLHICLCFIKKPKEAWLDRFFHGKVFKILLLLFLAGCGMVIWKRMDCPIPCLTLMGYGMMSGVIVLPIIVGLLLWKLFKEKDFLADNYKAVVCFSFLYAIFLYSAVFRVEIPQYYYYGRYLLPYLSLIIFMFVYLAKKIQWQWLLGIALFVGGFYAKYDMLLYAEPDDTLLTWETLTGILENIEDGEKTVVLIDDDIGVLYRLAVKGWTEADTYIVHDENLAGQLVAVEDNYDRIYYITQRDDEVDFNGNEFYEKVCLINRACEDGGITDKITKLPVEFVKNQTTQRLYEIEAPRYEYSMSPEEKPFEFFGFSNMEEGYAWICETEAGMECTLHKNAYTMTVFQGVDIPFDEIERELSIEIYFNEYLAGSYQLNADSKGKEFSMKIPKVWVNEGTNSVTYKMDDLWSPQEIGLDDNRQLGLSVSKLLFEKD